MFAFLPSYQLFLHYSLSSYIKKKKFWSSFIIYYFSFRSSYSAAKIEVISCRRNILHPLPFIYIFLHSSDPAISPYILRYFSYPPSCRQFSLGSSSSRNLKGVTSCARCRISQEVVTIREPIGMEAVCVARNVITRTLHMRIRSVQSVCTCVVREQGALPLYLDPEDRERAA